MGYRFRKSFNAGPVRVNLSKSGIGYSVGTKGARITKTANGRIRKTVGVPGTGISYVKESSGKSNTKQQGGANMVVHPDKKPIHAAAIDKMDSSTQVKNRDGSDCSFGISNIVKELNITDAMAAYLFELLLSIYQDQPGTEFTIHDVSVINNSIPDKKYYDYLYDRGVLNRNGGKYSLNVSMINKAISTLEELEHEREAPRLQQEKEAQRLREELSQVKIERDGVKRELNELKALVSGISLTPEEKRSCRSSVICAEIARFIFRGLVFFLITMIIFAGLEVDYGLKLRYPTIAAFALNVLVSVFSYPGKIQNESLLTKAIKMAIEHSNTLETTNKEECEHE